MSPHLFCCKGIAEALQGQAETMNELGKRPQDRMHAALCHGLYKLIIFVLRTVYLWYYYLKAIVLARVFENISIFLMGNGRLITFVITPILKKRDQ